MAIETRVDRRRTVRRRAVAELAVRIASPAVDLVRVGGGVACTGVRPARGSLRIRVGARPYGCGGEYAGESGWCAAVGCCAVTDLAVVVQTPTEDSIDATDGLDRARVVVTCDDADNARVGE